ncbi:MAG: hypothetical protein ACRD4H_05085, partial [Candidatus Acidiferrales bacterium]
MIAQVTMTLSAMSNLPLGLNSEQILRAADFLTDGSSPRVADKAPIYSEQARFASRKSACHYFVLLKPSKENLPYLAGGPALMPQRKKRFVPDRLRVPTPELGNGSPTFNWMGS